MQQYNNPIVVIGMGEMGELFARGFLKRGHPVFPILRGMPLQDSAARIPTPALVIAAVGEDDLDPLLADMPAVWRTRLALLQNELVPNDWQRHGIEDPTVIVVWFDKKKGRPFVAVLPTPVAGPSAALVVDALTAIQVPSYPIPREELLYQLIRKNLYILTINIAGLRLPPGTTVSQLWERHRPLAESVATEILSLQEWLAGSELPRERLIDGMLEGFAGDPHHICTGRTAQQRLRRALRVAESAGIAVPELHRLAAHRDAL
jgi:hypothetical protein